MSLYTIQFDESVHEKYRQMTLRGQYSFTLFTLDDKYTTISVEKTGEPGMAWADIVAQLPEKECRFVAFVFKYKTPGGESDRIKTGLLRWSPSGASLKSKTVYAATTGPLRMALATSNFELQASSVAELVYEDIVEKLQRKFS